jgi:uncharacterized repeat protein (TIGR01451 family)
VATLDGTPVTNGQVIDLSTLAAGDHTLTVVATDFYGNTTTKSVTFSVLATTIEKKVNRKKAYAGNILMFQIKVRNISPYPQEFTVSDTLPENTTYLRGDGYDPATNTVTWSDTVQPYGVKVTHIWARVNAGVEPHTEIVNTASLTQYTYGFSASTTTLVTKEPPGKGRRADVNLSDMVSGN